MTCRVSDETLVLQSKGKQRCFIWLGSWRKSELILQIDISKAKLCKCGNWIIIGVVLLFFNRNCWKFLFIVDFKNIFKTWLSLVKLPKWCGCQPAANAQQLIFGPYIPVAFYTFIYCSVSINTVNTRVWWVCALYWCLRKRHTLVQCLQRQGHTKVFSNINSIEPVEKLSVVPDLQLVQIVNL